MLYYIVYESNNLLVKDTFYIVLKYLSYFFLFLVLLFMAQSREPLGH